MIAILSSLACFWFLLKFLSWVSTTFSGPTSSERTQQLKAANPYHACTGCEWCSMMMARASARKGK